MIYEAIVRIQVVAGDEDIAYEGISDALNEIGFDDYEIEDIFEAEDENFMELDDLT